MVTTTTAQFVLNNREEIDTERREFPALFLYAATLVMFAMSRAPAYFVALIVIL